MNVHFARPDVSSLVFHVYGRSVHPELFRIHAERRYDLDRFSAILRLCDAGHQIELRHNGQTLTEIAADGEQEFPKHRRLLDRKLRGFRDDGFRLESGLKYQVSYQLERVDPEVFANLHEELINDCPRADLAYRFPPANRLAAEPISLIRADLSPRSFLVHAYHTFPESLAIVKSQSLFEV